MSSANIWVAIVASQKSGAMCLHTLAAGSFLVELRGGQNRPVSGGSLFLGEPGGDLVLWVYVGLRTLRADMEKLLLTHVTCDGE